MTLFACKLCGRTHAGIPDRVPEFPPEEVEQRRQAWLAADEKLATAPENEHYERAYNKAWFAYMATKSPGVERVPAELETKKAKSGRYLRCTNKVHVLPPDVAVEAAVYSTKKERDMVRLGAGMYEPKDVWTNPAGETVAVFTVGSIIMGTHWGPTPFARALQLAEPPPKKVKKGADEVLLSVPGSPDADADSEAV